MDKNKKKNKVKKQQLEHWKVTYTEISLNWLILLLENTVNKDIIEKFTSRVANNGY